MNVTIDTRRLKTSLGLPQTAFIKPFQAKPLATWVLLTFLNACGGGGPAPTPISYEGSWYQPELDVYLVIDTNHQAVIRKCSSTGYKVTDQGTGTVNGNTVTWPDGSAVMARNGNTLTVDSLDFVLASAPPAICTGNYVEITSLTPTSAVAGTSSLFTVNFVYQLSSQSTGIIELGFNTAAADTPELETNPFAVTQGTGSGSLQATVTPILYPEPDHFEVSVFLSETVHPDLWTPLANDRKTIVVSAPVVSTLLQAPSNNPAPRYVCQHRIWKNLCANHLLPPAKTDPRQR